MKLLVLGGHDRMKARVKELSKRYGVNISFINQETQQNIDNALACADWVIVFTSLVGHNMVKLAKSYAKEKCIFCHSHGVCSLEREIKRLLKHYDSPTGED
ncbi:MAG: DUF2325 domain-containing protein [Aquificaceae bacterium]|nr:DUF2325 domain-containing protein [Aquificaceae bacterium]MCX8059737.1 DUF2325 domain-containing protein [Aquificaceae bacterium]MDW8097739.1 DUF2325 domain-containing protein [Aquificaceae bacterium]